MMNYKRRILNLATRVGLSYELMSAYDQFTGNIRRIRPSDEMQSYDPQIPMHNKQILFPLIPGYRSFALRYCVLAHAFRTKGYEPIFLYDDDDIPAKPGVTVDYGDERTLNRKKTRAKRSPTNFGIEKKRLRKIATTNKKARKIETQNRDALVRLSDYPDGTIEKYVKASLRKYLKKYRLNLSDPVEHDLYIEFLQSAIMISYACQEITKRKNLKCIVSHEQSYIQGGIPMEVGRSAGIDVYIQGLGYHEGELMFGRARNHVPQTQFANRNLMTDAVETRLSKPEKKKIDEVMKKRQNNENTRADYAVQDGTAYDTNKSVIVGVFSHLLWDAALEPEEGVYSDFYTWLDDTISAGLNMNDVEFIIKAHPAEDIRGTNEPIKDWLTEQYDTLPDNISFLPPDTDVNTYQLFDQLDAGVVFASTVGLEMAYHRIPVVVGGYPPYHGYGLTHTPSTKPEYKQLINDIKTLECSDEMKARAIRFAHFLFECQSVDFPYLSELSNTDGNVVIEHNEITREESPYQKIAEQILNGEEVLDPSCRNADNEDGFSK